MKATLFKEVESSLSKLIEDIDLCEIALPDIQRSFICNTAKVRVLLDSMNKGFLVTSRKKMARIIRDGIEKLSKISTVYECRFNMLRIITAVTAVDISDEATSCDPILGN